MKLKDIDFRLWDKKKAEFIDLNKLIIAFLKDDLQKKGKFVLMNPNFVCSPVLNADDFEIEPYLHIKDMHGNKLYENDIVYFQYQSKTIEKEVTLGIIVFKNNSFYCKAFKTLYPLSAVKILRVVGHIHENLDDLETELVDLIDENATESLIFELKHKIRFLRDMLVFLAENKESK